MSIALLLMIKDEFNSAKNIIKSVKGICEENIIVMQEDKTPKKVADFFKKYIEHSYTVGYRRYRN